MKKLFTLTGLLLAMAIGVTAHPVHVSVVNITVDGELLKISINTFSDDWETAYFHYHGKQASLSTPEDMRDSWFMEYLEASFTVSFGEKDQQLNLVLDSVRFDNLSMHLEMYAILNEKPKTLYIYNAILTDIFYDQTNLLIYSSGNKEKGVKFDYHNKEEELNLR